MIKIPQWAIQPIMIEAVKEALEIIKLNEFPRITVKEQELLSKLVIDRMEKINSKKELKQLINSTEFSQIVYQELATIYTAR